MQRHETAHARPLLRAEDMSSTGSVNNTAPATQRAKREYRNQLKQYRPPIRNAVAGELVNRSV
jgi:hypothetical protein